MAIKDWSTSASLNTSVGGVDISPGCARANMDNMGRAIMADVRTVLDENVRASDYGIVGDGVTNDTAALAAILTDVGTDRDVDLGGKSCLATAIPVGLRFFNGTIVFGAANTDDEPKNTAFGEGAFISNTYVPFAHPAGGGIDYASGNYVTAYGADALRSNTTGRRNTAMGGEALRENTTGFYLTAIGAFALAANTNGEYNTAVGNQSQQAVTTGDRNVSLGNGTLTQATTGSDNVALGDNALSVNSNRSIGVGTQAGWKVTGADNIVLGYQAMSNPAGPTGTYNIVIGQGAAGSWTTASDNVAIGKSSQTANAAGTNCISIGTDSMIAAVGAIHAVAIGNTALGNATGTHNIGIGKSAGVSITSGTYNTLVGADSAVSAATDTNCLILGYGATGTAANQVVLGNASISTFRCQVALTVVSDERDKQVVAPMPGLEFINDISTFVGRWDKRVGENPEGTFAFLGAGNMRDVQKKHGIDLGLVNDTDPEHLEATYERMIPVLVKCIQELYAKLDAL